MWEGLWLNSVFQNRFWEIKKRGALTGSHVAYGLVRVDLLLGRRADAQHADPRPGVFERLMQAQDASRPQVDISLAVGTLFGLIPS
ncbi:YaiY family protein [Klebsiella pneumoniae subsp. pneumoniae]|nr:YaiY family protein [Klebsiella pneumoniae subsp. pneumoniae]